MYNLVLVNSTVIYFPGALRTAHTRFFSVVFPTKKKQFEPSALEQLVVVHGNRLPSRTRMPTHGVRAVTWRITSDFTLNLVYDPWPVRVLGCIDLM